MVFDETDGVVQVKPVPIDEPPVDEAYQLTVPADTVAPKITVPTPQRDAGVVPVIDGLAYAVELPVAWTCEPFGALAVTVAVLVKYPAVTLAWVAVWAAWYVHVSVVSMMLLLFKSPEKYVMLLASGSVTATLLRLTWPLLSTVMSYCTTSFTE